MARPQIREVSAPSRLQGIAAPVSTYVRPADPASSPLNQLAEGLAAFDQGLGGFLSQRKAENDAAQKSKAMVDFHRNNQKSFADAQREGLIPATANRSYIEWYKRQSGNLAGLKLSDKFSIDYQSWSGRDSDDPNAFQSFVGGWMKQNVGEEQDPYILEGLAPHLDRIAMGGYETFETERAASLKKRATSTSGAILTDTLSRSAEGASSEGLVDYEGLWSGIMAQREDFIAQGNRGEEFDALMVDSIILQAEESGSKEMLKLLDRALPGQELSMASSPEVKEKRLRAIDRINNKQASQATDIAQTREALEKQEHERKLAEAVLILSNGEDVPEETIVHLSRRDGEIRNKLAKIKGEYGDRAIEEDPAALMHIYAEIDSGAGEKFVTEMRTKGVIKNPATYLKAIDRVKAINKAAGDGGVFTSPTYKDTVKLITNATGYGEFAALDGMRGLSDESLEALYDYRNMLLDWDLKNPESNLLEKEKAAKEIGEIIRGRITATTSGDSVGTYESEADRAAKQQPTAPPAAEPGATPPAAQETQPDGGYVQDAWDWLTQPEPQEAAPVVPLENRSDSFKQSLQDFAAKKGLSVDEAYTVIQNRAKKVDPEFSLPNPMDLIRDATEGFRNELQGFEQSLGSETQGRAATGEELAVNPMNAVRGATSGFREGVQGFEQSMGASSEGVAATNLGGVSQEARSKLTALLQDPPKVERLAASNVPVAPLLGLIGNTEGTDKGDGYNETLGYGAYTGGDVNLVGMTLGDIDKLQTQMLRHKNNKWNSSAIGRYQIIRTTLRGLKEEMGLTDDVLFDEELQDRMAMHLLERRGLSKWQAGQMSDDQFMNNLSAEWASLPKANGKGTYRGQRVGTSTGGVMTAFDQIRNRQGGTEVASLDPSIGMGSDPYVNIPDTDSRGQGGQKSKFLEWNPDPIGNHETNLQSVDQDLANVVRRAQEIAGVQFVVGSGKRDAAMQKKAVEWGWSKTEDSDHIHGESVDLWPVENGAVKFDPAMQQEIVMAMKLAAQELGVSLDIGAEWKSFKDKPHFGIKRKG